MSPIVGWDPVWAARRCVRSIRAGVQSEERYLIRIHIGDEESKVKMDSEVTDLQVKLVKDKFDVAY